MFSKNDTVIADPKKRDKEKKEYIKDQQKAEVHPLNTIVYDVCQIEDSYATAQWAAVRTQFWLIRDPPQKWKPLGSCLKDKSIRNMTFTF